MSILSKNGVGSNSTGSGGTTPFFHEFKKQASFFLKEKIRSARLVLTDVTPIQLTAEEAINGSPSSPDAQTLGRISKAAFEVDDYWRIVDIMHDTLLRFERKNWRESYNCLIVLEHLLTHGPESVAEEFQSDTEVVTRIGSFQYIDERGFNWGLAVKKKSERVLKLLEKGPLLKEERDRARKITRGISGFGSLSHTSSSTEAILIDSGNKKTDDSESSGENVEPGKEEENNREEEQHQWNSVAESRSLLLDETAAVVNGADTADYHPFSDTEHRASSANLLFT